MSELTDLFSELNDDKPTNKTVSDSKYHFIVSYIIDNRYTPDPEVLDYHYITVKGDMDSDMYFSEVVQNAAQDDLDEILEGVEEGIYRLVLGVTIESYRSWTDWGYEYDEDHYYDLISKYQLTEKEISICCDGWCNVDDTVEFK